MTRTEPPFTGSEAEILVGFLDHHRDTLRMKTDGLGAAQLDQRLEPSTMSLGGLLKHLAYVEDWWLNQVFAGNPPPEPWASVDWKADGDWEWHSAAQDTPDQLRALFDGMVTASDRILHTALADPGALDQRSRRTFRSDRSREYSLRYVLVHLIEEYARHNGHADLLRESIDGQVGA
jgi:uncharacterized damage-inducible protein DinB